MKKIPLTQGQFALVDDDMFDFLNQWKWFYTIAKDEHTGYARRKTRHPVDNRRFNLSMHRIIMNTKEGEIVDHIDGNGLNNQKSNLRICTAGENAWNRRISKSKKLDACRGVSKVKDKRGVQKYWIARITYNYERIYLGTFPTKELAEQAYVEAARKYYGNGVILDRIFD
jgi:hypothetical protein